MTVDVAAAPEPVPEEVEVTVVGDLTPSQTLEQSAEAVTVIRLRKARQQTADLGEVLARTQGINIRRQGGLGTESAILLNGLQGDQIRFFVDGVPLAMGGYPFGLTNMPVNLLDQVEIYRGVVPVRFGTDALGGAINLVTDQTYESHLTGSYQVGSFGLHRATAGGRYRHEDTGLVVGSGAYLDVAENDYFMIDRPVPRDDGSADILTLPRFHDAYRAYGGNIEAGFVDRSWAKKLIVQGLFGNSYKELQHNRVMSIPYGEVNTTQSTYGATARYDVDLTDTLTLDLLFNYSFRSVNWQDLATHKYRWTGEQGKTIGRDIAPGVPAQGEISGKAMDESIYTHALFGRAGLSWTFLPRQIARISISPQGTFRKGDDHVPDRVDLLGLRQSVKQLIGGIDYELNAFGERFSNIAFGKFYYQAVFFEGLTERNAVRVKYSLENDATYYGGGDSMRYRFTDWLLAKLSYEYATRLPRPDEMFGDGVLVITNVDLKPERGHNVNLGPRLELPRTVAGAVTAEVNALLRETKDQIQMFANVQGAPYENVLNVRSLGIEGMASWESPGRYVGVDFSATYQELRNTSDSGRYEATKGRRMPNKPWLFGSAGLHGRAPELFLPGDALEPFANTRYVRGYDRAWALGNPDFKLDMPSQWSHTVGITYSLTRPFSSLFGTFEIDNFTDEALYDNYGVQRPGRSFAFKLSGQL